MDKVPAETRRNILTLGGVKVGSPLTHRPPFLSPAKVCNTKEQSSFVNSKETRPPASQTDEQLTDSRRHFRTSDTLPYTKDAPQPPPVKVPEGPDRTLEASDLSPESGWVTSTPLLAPADSVQLKLPPDGGSHSVKYTRNSEERLECDHSVRPAHRTEQVAQRLLHTTL